MIVALLLQRNWMAKWPHLNAAYYCYVILEQAIVEN